MMLIISRSRTRLCYEYSSYSRRRIINNRISNHERNQLQHHHQQQQQQKCVSSSKMRTSKETTTSTGSTCSNSNKSNNTIDSSAMDISSIFNLDKSKSIEIAKLLSSSTRNELSQVNKVMLSSLSKNNGGKSITEPSTYELQKHALNCGIPFIGFGIMDNAILILAGDQIDTHLGVLFGMSTLCAAAIGNIISDIAGVGLGATIEDFCSTKLKLPPVNLSTAQRNLRSVRFAGQVGIMIGLTIGCIIGLFPLLFIDSDQVQYKKQDARMDKIFYDVVSEVKGLVGAESTCLYLIVDDDGNDGKKDKNHNEKNNNNRSSTTTIYPMPFEPMKDDVNNFYLLSKYEAGNVSIPKGKGGHCMKEPISKGIVGRAAVTGQVMIVKDVESDPDYDPSLYSFHKTKDNKVKNMLCVPVFNIDGKTIAVIQAINKVEHGAANRHAGLSRRLTLSSGFTEKDVKVIQSLASHVSVTLQNMRRGEVVSLKEIVQLLKEHGTVHPNN